MVTVNGSTKRKGKSKLTWVAVGQKDLGSLDIMEHDALTLQEDELRSPTHPPINSIEKIDSCSWT